jgi:hypothetical protein
VLFALFGVSNGDTGTKLLCNCGLEHLASSSRLIRVGLSPIVYMERTVILRGAPGLCLGLVDVALEIIVAGTISSIRGNANVVPTIDHHVPRAEWHGEMLVLHHVSSDQFNERKRSSCL